MNKTTLNSQKEKHSMLSLRRATFRRQRARRGPQHFYPRSPCGERRCQTLSDCRYTAISIHALLAESDVAGLIFRAKFVIFLSTLSLRRATSAPAIKSCWSSYFYPRSPCGERLRVSVGDAHVCVISIHALLAESDQLLLDRGLTRDDISIHALLAESDTTFSGTVHRKEISIHALLAESDLCRCCVRSCSWHYFYPRSPCGERRGTYVSASPANVISIHALLAESDGQYPVTAMMCKIFLSTLSLRRATSGHLHTGALHKVFLSTLSLRRATPCYSAPPAGRRISIHALLAESDQNLQIRCPP